MAEWLYAYQNKATELCEHYWAVCTLDCPSHIHDVLYAPRYLGSILSLQKIYFMFELTSRGR